MKKLAISAIVAFVLSFFAAEVNAGTYIVYQVNGGTFLYYTHRDINCSTFQPGPGITILDCWNSTPQQ